MPHAPVTDALPLRTLLRFQDLAKTLDVGDAPYPFTGHDPDDHSAVLKGIFLLVRLHSGLRIHASDAVECQDSHAERTLPPALTVSVLLSGTVSATLDDRRLHYAADSGPRGMMWSLTQPTRLVRQIRRDQRVRKVNISVTPRWFHEIGSADGRIGSGLQQFRFTHLAMQDWQPTRTALRLAEEILTGHGEDGILNRLSLEIRALAILGDAFSLFDPPAPAVIDGARPSPRLSVRDAARARLARGYIDAHLAEPVTLRGIAGATGMSVSTLQRAFKTLYGITVIEHLRFGRLDAARNALCADGLTIQQAAHLAGFSSAANFATAFRRRFGYPPSHCTKGKTPALHQPMSIGETAGLEFNQEKARGKQ